MMGNMGEVNTLTDRLAMMPDSQLPRLAQQYKGDAITLSLILGEKNRRDRVRNSMKAQAGAQPQPKVNDQIVASMQPQLPEDVGIGALPAPNMERMADGGITGYGDDAELLYHNEPVMRMAGGGVARYADQGLVRSPLAFLNPSDLWSGVSRVFSEGIDPVAAEQRRQAALRKLSTPPEETVGTPEFAAAQEALRTKTTAEGRALPGEAPKGGLGDIAPKTTPPAAQAQPAAPAGPNMGSIKEQYLKDVEKFAPKSETAEDYTAKRKAMLGEEGQALSKYEAKLLAQEAAAPGEKDQAFWMAITQAGLAAAAGSSPHALKNIAEGFGTGLAGYKEALKEFKKAEQERTKAIAEIEQARRAEKRGDVDAALAYETKSKERLDKHNDRVSAGLAALAGAEVTGQYSLAGHRISASAANRTPAEIQLIERYQSDPKFAAAYDKLAVAKREPQTQEALMKAWSANPALQMQYPNPQDYIKIMQGSAGLGGASQLSPSDRALIDKYAR